MQNFNKYEGLKYHISNDIPKTIEIIANRFIGENPRVPYTYRAFSEAGFIQMEDGRVLLDIGNRNKGAKLGDFCYAMCSIYLDSPLNHFDLGLNCFGPTTIYHNGSHLYTSSTYEEVDNTYMQIVFVDMVKGWNVFFLKMECVATGFGCIFGSARDSLNPMRYLSPFKERAGRAGFIASEVCNEDVLENIPFGGELESQSPVKWYPDTKWDNNQITKLQLYRIYGACANTCAYGITDFETDYILGTAQYTIKGKSAGEITIWIDEQEVYKAKGGIFEEKIKMFSGTHRITVKSCSTDADFGFELALYSDKMQEIEFISPLNIKGTFQSWIYIGTFPTSKEYNPENFKRLHKIIDERYFRLDEPAMCVRPYIDAILFGRWNYPLGVTLFGLLRAGQAINRPDITEYAINHLTNCIGIYEYALWDKKRYGYPSVDQKLIELNMLDDCGSCGSTMLEAYSICKNKEFLDVADVIADFILNKVDRQPDGAYFRVQPGKFHDNTLWADDLYMSVPFLTRYYIIKKDTNCLEDGIKQLLLFKEYLFIDEQNLMSHVYDFNHHTANFMPWGRGNGWVLFSLSELLERLPTDHKQRPKLIEFFRQLSEGVLEQQGENGLWHQLLTDQVAYEETSCSCMFIYAMSRGIRLSLYEKEAYEKYFLAIKYAWDGLISRAIDFKGNVYGVCWGSRYAFKKSYYTKELGWAKNDTHGIGISMLAAIEYDKLNQFLKAKQ